MIEVTMVERRIMRTPRPVSKERQKIIAFHFSSLDSLLLQTILAALFKFSGPSLEPPWGSFVLRRNWFAPHIDQVEELLIMMEDGFQK